ncbi:hypothetical protein DPMN_006338 [Dreissena polymorpha]|uniref:Uncharacterized protein n=1 Tax=Dreissena polymorpha TaxID=45954 RepID=A0A9D4MUD3_DREPO|nr:hypothetical protein DPMN_006338 [Dreissena polymorpha]
MGNGRVGGLEKAFQMAIWVPGITSVIAELTMRIPRVATADLLGMSSVAAELTMPIPWVATAALLAIDNSTLAEELAMAMSG